MLIYISRFNFLPVINLYFQVLHHSVLPGYHFRDDALLLYNAINTYVKKYVDLYYGKMNISVIILIYILYLEVSELISY